MTTKLTDLPVLLIDCQATAANPQTGQLLEIGWAEVCARDAVELRSAEPCSYLVAWPEGKLIPRRVSRVTGLATEDLTSGPTRTPIEIWEELRQAALRTASGGGARSSCPAVIHFARFERAYLEYLHKELDPEDRFPFDILCTHEITKRLLPDLPRRGLRAVAGYFGHSVPELRRSQSHVIATGVIWQRLVEILDRRHGVRTKEDLTDWLASTNGSQSTGRAYPMDPKARLGLPDRPGIYRMRRSNGDLLYIGKAKSLARRVNSYFQKKRHHPEHTLEMLTQASRVDVTETATALEAALLESDEIKRLSPPYNIALRIRDRQLSYCSTDLTRSSIEPDDIHQMGPLPSQDSLKPVGWLALRIAQLTSNPIGEDEISTALGLPAEYAPEEGCFVAGLDLFRQKYGAKLNPGRIAPALINLGTALWQEKLASVDEETEDEEEEEKEKEEGERVWSPEAVVSSLESVVLRGTHLLRRARWLCLLSESSLVWDVLTGSAQGKNLLVLEKGKVAKREELPEGAQAPVPSGYRKRRCERQKNFDLMTHDRLIVLTTELRRLTSEGRRLAIRLGPTTILRGEKLREALRWI